MSTASIIGSKTLLLLPSVAGVRIPDSALAKAAAQLGHFTAEIGRAHIREFACPTIESTIMAAPYAD